MASLNREQLQRLEDKYVNRTMRCVPEKFIELCHMHLAFLLDLSDDKLEMLLCAEDEPRKRKSGFGAAGIFKKKGQWSSLSLKTSYITFCFLM